MTLSPRFYAKTTMYTGIAMTLGGNVGAASLADPLGMVVNACAALALLLTFEMITRGRAIPSRRRWYHAAMRIVPAVAIMIIAAWGSYGHLYAFVTAHGQHGLSAVLMAALPDAMMLLATAVLRDTPQTRRPAPAKAKAKTAKATKKAPAKNAAAAPAATRAAAVPRPALATA